MTNKSDVSVEVRAELQWAKTALYLVGNKLRAMDFTNDDTALLNLEAAKRAIDAALLANAAITSESATQVIEPVAVQEAKGAPVVWRIGGRYNWRNQQERLVYLGRNWSGNGFWHQFEKVDEPGRVWCEVLDADLLSFEETPTAPAAPTEPYEPNPDGIKPGQNHVRMDPDTGMWEEPDDNDYEGRAGSNPASADERETAGLAPHPIEQAAPKAEQDDGAPGADAINLSQQLVRASNNILTGGANLVDSNACIAASEILAARDAQGKEKP